jgi:hypothetical protein
VVDQGCFKTTAKVLEKWFTDMPPAWVAMEARTHSIWISEQLEGLGHEVILVNIRELRAIALLSRQRLHVTSRLQEVGEFQVACSGLAVFMLSARQPDPYRHKFLVVDGQLL